MGDLFHSIQQARGTNRRIQNNAREGNVPPSLRAFTLFREEKTKQMNGSKMSATAVSDAWKALTHANRKLYLDAAMAENASKHSNTQLKATATAAVAAATSADAHETDASTAAAAAVAATKKSKSKKKGKSAKDKTTTIDTPVLREIRRFDNVQELVSIFGPAACQRFVSSMLTPSGRVKVKHFVRNPVLLKFDGRHNELSVGFSVAAEFVRSR